MKDKRRYSIPAKLIELLWTDDEFFRDVSNLKKASISRFPKNDQWADHDGFHLEFALAGYSSDDIEIVAIGSMLSISGNGLEISPSRPLLSTDPFEEYVKDTKSAIHYGNIIRGIARRSFSVKFTVSEEFDLSKACSTMKNGLLHIVIPECEKAIPQNIEIKH